VFLPFSPAASPQFVFGTCCFPPNAQPLQNHPKVSLLLVPRNHFPALPLALPLLNLPRIPSSQNSLLYSPLTLSFFFNRPQQAFFSVSLSSQHRHSPPHPAPYLPLTPPKTLNPPVSTWPLLAYFIRPSKVEAFQHSPAPCSNTLQKRLFAYTPYAFSQDPVLLSSVSHLSVSLSLPTPFPPPCLSSFPILSFHSFPFAWPVISFARHSGPCIRSLKTPRLR